MNNQIIALCKLTVELVEELSSMSLRVCFSDETERIQDDLRLAAPPPGNGPQQPTTPAQGRSQHPNTFISGSCPS